MLNCFKEKNLSLAKSYFRLPNTGIDRIAFSQLVGWVSMFNGISTFVGYLMPKPFS